MVKVDISDLLIMTQVGPLLAELTSARWEDILPPLPQCKTCHAHRQQRVLVSFPPCRSSYMYVTGQQHHLENYFFHPNHKLSVSVRCELWNSKFATRRNIIMIAFYNN